MIFLTVGTHEPFDRLVRTVDEWCTSRRYPAVFAQIANPGPLGYRPRNFEWVGHLAPDAYEARFRSAAMVVSHAGMGSIITAMQLGKRIVVLPRRGDLRETRNDHQIATARRLKDRTGIHVAMAEQDLPGVLDAAFKNEGSSAPRIAAFAETRMTTALRAFIFDIERSRHGPERSAGLPGAGSARSKSLNGESL